ncbi:MAG: YihY family inner membrane protein [Ghiorsea sp.]|nr:YihY family inner membrane protein [Ghiorsea sp.]
MQSAFKVIHQGLNRCLHVFIRSNQHFFRTQSTQFAASLSYSTLLAVVPLAVFLVYLSLQIEALSSFFILAKEQAFAQLLPTSQASIEIYLAKAAQNITSFSYLSLFIVFLSIVWLSLAIEKAFNHIWQVKIPRHLMLRLPTHLILWLFAPFFVIISIMLTTWFASLPYLSSFQQHISVLSYIMPWATASFALFLLYFFVPNTKVLAKHALFTAMLVAALFELSKWLFTLYITKIAMYEKIYGALASLPIFMLWVYITWLIVLWGVSLNITLQSLSQSQQGHPE